MSKSSLGLIDRLDHWRYRRLVPGWYKRSDTRRSDRRRAESSRRMALTTAAHDAQWDERMAVLGLSDLLVDHVDEDGVARLANGKRLDKRVNRLIDEHAPHLRAEPAYERQEIKRSLRVAHTRPDGELLVTGGRPLKQELRFTLNGIFPRGPEIPVMGTPEGRARLRASGVPLDEWVDMSSPAWQADQERKHREGKRGAIVLGAIVLTPLAVWWGWDIAHQQTPAEKLPLCPEQYIAACRFTDERGPGVRLIQEDGQPVLISPAQYNEEVYAILEEGAPECPSGFRGEC